VIRVSAQACSPRATLEQLEEPPPGSQLSADAKALMGWTPEMRDRLRERFSRNEEPEPDRYARLATERDDALRAQARAEAERDDALRACKVREMECRVLSDMRERAVDALNALIDKDIPF
jgi:hypothetical protein